MPPDIPTASPYRAATAGAIRQGEVISDLVTYQRVLGSNEEFQPIQHRFAVVVSQDCDLEWDHKSRFPTEADTSRSNAKELPCVLFCMASLAADAKLGAPSSKVWERIVQNKEERYQFLQRVAAECDFQGSGLPALVLDFKRYFTIPSSDLYEQVSSTAKRRCVLESPYLEHLSSRFVYFQCRVALPAEHLADL